MYNIKYIRSVTRGMPVCVCIKYSKTMKIKLTIKKLKLVIGRLRTEICKYVKDAICTCQ